MRSLRSDLVGQAIGKAKSTSNVGSASHVVDLSSIRVSVLAFVDLPFLATFAEVK